jgi:hypothetical protein
MLPDTVRLFGDRVQFISLQVMVNRPKLFSCLTDRLDVIHDLSFWDYLKDRLLGIGDIPPLSEVIRAAAACG